MALTCSPPRLMLACAVLAVVFSGTGVSAQRRPDPAPPFSEYVRSNLARRSSSVVVRPTVRQVLANERYGPERNLLPARRALPFTPFPRVNPATGRAPNPNARIRLPNGREMSVREFYDAVDQTEQQLNQRGYTLRDRNTFTTVRLNRAPVAASRTGTSVPIRPVRVTTPASGNARPDAAVPSAARGGHPPAPSGRPSTTAGRTVARAGRGGTLDQREAAMAARIRGIAPPQNGAFAGEPPPPPSATTQLEGNNAAGSTAGEKGGFAIWAPQIEVSGTDTHAFRFRTGANTQRVVWQVSTEPFPSAAPASYTDWQTPPGLVRTGTTECLTGSWCTFDLSFLQIAGGPPPATPVYYFVRVLPIWTANPGTLLGIPSNQVVVRYGPATPQLPIELRTVETQGNYAPRRFTHPSGGAPDFQIWLDAQTLNVSTARVNGVPVGMHGDAHLLMRSRIFNPAHIVDASQPRNLEFTLLGVDFLAQAGLDPATALSGGGIPVQPRARVNVIVADQAYPLVDQTGTPGQPLVIDCQGVAYRYNPESRLWVWFGPVPIEVWVGAYIDYGVSCLGRLEADPSRVQFYAQPFGTAQVYGGAQTNLLIAWAGLHAELTLAEERIFLEIDTDKAVAPFAGRHELNNALKGRIYFTAGFYHPCPPIEQVEKIFGFVTGDDDVPLCSTSFEQTLIDSPGTSFSAALF